MSKDKIEFKTESWEDFYGKKIHVLKDGAWKESYVTEDGFIFTGRTATLEQLNKQSKMEKKNEKHKRNLQRINNY